MVAVLRVKIADQVWLALALLTKEQPVGQGFSANAISERVRVEFGRVAPGIPTHISQHCVATKKPNPGRYRMITKTPDGANRLFRPGDPYHPDREGAKTLPSREEIDRRYQKIIDWYEHEYAPTLKILGPEAKLLQFKPVRGSGLHDVAERHDEYLAEEWSSQPNGLREVAEKHDEYLAEDSSSQPKRTTD